jgi:hypothetical protein
MIIRSFLLSLCLLSALSASADPIADVRSALSKLEARESIRATYELDQSIDSKGKLDNEKFAGKASVEIEGDASGFRIIVPRSTLDQVEREQQGNIRNAEQSMPTVSALGQIEPVDVVDALDFAPTLLRMMDGAKLVSDSNGTFQGRPMRVLVMRAASRLDADDAKKMKMIENKLTLWIGPDLLPVGAEHVMHTKLSFLIFRAEFKDKKSWYLTHVADRLVRVRRETSSSGSGMGQHMSEATVAVVRVH